LVFTLKRSFLYKHRARKIGASWSISYATFGKHQDKSRSCWFKCIL